MNSRLTLIGDAVADIAYRVRVPQSRVEPRRLTTRARVEGAQATGTGDGGQVIPSKAHRSRRGVRPRRRTPATIAFSRAGAAILFLRRAWRAE